MAQICTRPNLAKRGIVLSENANPSEEMLGVLEQCLHQVFPEGLTFEQTKMFDNVIRIIRESQKSSALITELPDSEYALIVAALRGAKTVPQATRLMASIYECFGLGD